MKKLFIKFLKVKGVYKQYVNNWKNDTVMHFKPIKKPCKQHGELFSVNKCY